MLRRAIEDVRDSVREGEGMAAPLENSKVCEPLVVDMVQVGEETGNLELMLRKVAETYEEDVDVAVEGLTSMLDPLMVIFMGAVIGFIVIALFLPLIRVAGSL